MSRTATHEYILRQQEDYIGELDKRKRAGRWTKYPVKVWGRRNRRSGANRGNLEAFPFPVRRIHSDNGPEFMNAVIHAYETGSWPKAEIRRSRYCWRPSTRTTTISVPA